MASPARNSEEDTNGGSEGQRKEKKKRKERSHEHLEQGQAKRPARVPVSVVGPDTSEKSVEDSDQAAKALDTRDTKMVPQTPNSKRDAKGRSEGQRKEKKKRKERSHEHLEQGQAKRPARVPVSVVGPDTSESEDDSDYARADKSDSSSDEKKKKRKRKEGRTAEPVYVEDLFSEESEDDSDQATTDECESDRSIDDETERDRKEELRLIRRALYFGAEPVEEDLLPEETGEGSEHTSDETYFQELDSVCVSGSDEKKKKKKKKREKGESVGRFEYHTGTLDAGATPEEEDQKTETGTSAVAASKKKKNKKTAQPAQQREVHYTTAPLAQAEGESDDGHSGRQRDSGSSRMSSAAEHVPQETEAGSQKKKKQKKSKKARKREQRLRESAMEEAGEPVVEADAAMAAALPPGQAVAEAEQDTAPAEKRVDYILDFQARSRHVQTDSLIFLQHLDAEMDECSPSLEAEFESVSCAVPKYDIMRQLWIRVTTREFTILHGEEGCGKTTAALMLAEHACRRISHEVLWCKAEGLLRALNTKRSSTDYSTTLLIVDNFLGHTTLDGYDVWKSVLAKIRRGALRNTHVLLVTRTSVLQQGLAVCGADFADFIRREPLVELTLNREVLYRNMFPGASQTPDFSASFTVGFPALCKLASAVPEHMQMEMFNKPRSTLRRIIKDMCCRRVPTAALALMAVTEDYIDLRKLRCKSVLEKSKYLNMLRVLLGKNVDSSKARKILDFYSNHPELVKIEDDFASFTNEVVREAVLCVLCESHAYFLASHCSLRLLSRLALVTRDPEQTEDDDEKAVLPSSARPYLVNRLIMDIRHRDFRQTLNSALFEHPSFANDFKAATSKSHLVWAKLCDRDKKELRFLFWVSACPILTSKVVSLVKRIRADVCREGLVGACYWGNLELFRKLIKKESDSGRERILSSKLKALVLNPGEVKWEHVPFHKADTLLTLAARRGKDEMVRELVAMGADVDLPGFRNRTALMHYCARANHEMVPYLIDHKARVDLIDSYKNTALHYAVLGGLKQIHEDLFHPKAMEARNKWGEHPFQLACACGERKSTLKELRRGAGETDLFACLREACLNGRLKVIRYLYKLEAKGESVFADRDATEQAEALADSLLNSHTDEIVDILLPKLDKSDGKKLRTLCEKFCEHYDTRVLEAVWPLLKASSKKARRTLRKMCRVGNKRGVSFLLRSRPRLVEEKVLKAAAFFGSSEFMSWIFAQTDQKVTRDLIMYTLAIRRTEVVKFFLTSHDTSNGAFVADVAGKDAGAGAEAETDVNPESYLHLAARLEMVPIITWLLDKGRVDVNLPDPWNHTAVFLACQENQERSVKCLLLYGAQLPSSMKRDEVDTAHTEGRLVRALKKCTREFPKTYEQRRKDNPQRGKLRLYY